ncbi:MAG: transposase [Gammaproteobacteria bacterium]
MFNRGLQPESVLNRGAGRFNGRLRDECLNENWFTSLAHARAVIEAWRREYNEERPKKSLGGLTPAAYAQQLAARPLQLPDGSNAKCY